MNKTILLFLLVLCFVPLLLQAQKEQLVRTDTLKSQFFLTQEDKDLSPKTIPIKNDLNTIINLKQLALSENTDLKIDFSLIELEKDFYYQPISIELSRNDKIIHLPIEKRRGDLGILNTHSKTNYQIILNDVLEGNLYFGYEYELQLVCQLIGTGLNCAEGKPKFSMSFSDRWPYYSTAAAGGVLLGVGLNFNRRIDTEYNNYVQVWEDGQIKEVAISAWDKANQNKKNSNTYMIIGGSLVAASAIGLLTRYFFRHRPKVKQYNKYCGSKNNKSTQAKFGFIQTTNGAGIALNF